MKKKFVLTILLISIFLFSQGQSAGTNNKLIGESDGGIPIQNVQKHYSGNGFSFDFASCEISGYRINPCSAYTSTFLGSAMDFITIRQYNYPGRGGFQSRSQIHFQVLDRLNTMYFILPERDITEIPNSILFSANRNFNESLNMSILFYDNGVGFKGKSPSGIGNGKSGTFIGKWEILTGKPVFGTPTTNYLQLKRTNNSTISDKQIYRTGANIFNFVMSSKYPSLNRPK